MNSAQYKQQILRIIQGSGDKMWSWQELEEQLERPTNRPELRIALKDLENAKILKYNPENGWYLLRARGELGGVYRANERGFGFVTPDRIVAEGDLFIPAGKQADALDGDRVLVQVLKDDRNSKPGKAAAKVIKVIERNMRPMVGSVFTEQGQWWVEVDAKRHPGPIKVADAQSKGAREGSKVVVEIFQHAVMGHQGVKTPAEGVIVEVLGAAGEADVELQAILLAYGLSEKFPDDVMQQAREAAGRFEKELAENPCGLPTYREDWRDVLITTIDPPDAKDYDDAISIKTLESGGWELGVHIADVAHFVEPGTPLDEEAKSRANSTYLPRKVIPMLPEILSNGVCSLQEGVPRYALTCVMRLDANGEVQAQRVCKTLICSRRRMTYLEAQAVIDGDLKEAANHCKTTAEYPKEVIAQLQEMNNLARTLQKRRLRAGMIELGLPEVELEYGDDGHIVDAHLGDDAYTHKLIEMFMVEANEAAARIFAAQSWPMIRRVHADPQEDQDQEGLSSIARVAGYVIPRQPSRKQLQWLLAEVRQTPNEQPVSMGILRTMSRAEYSPELIGHYALASDHYAHFTSPIRRYPDLILHRGLDIVIESLSERENDGWAQANGRYKVPQSRAWQRGVVSDARMLDVDALHSAGQHCSEKERNSTAAERELTKLMILHLLEDKIGERFDAICTGVQNRGAFIQIERFQVDGFVPTDLLTQRDTHSWKMAPNGRLQTPAGESVGIGDRFVVEVLAVDLSRRQLELRVIDRLTESKPTKRENLVLPPHGLGPEVDMRQLGRGDREGKSRGRFGKPSGSRRDDRNGRDDRRGARGPGKGRNDRSGGSDNKRRGPGKDGGGYKKR